MYELENIWIQTARKQRVGHDIPYTYMGFFWEKSSVFGPQIEAVGLG